MQSLVAPIALYPDSLVAQILNAATFPDQIAVANYWLQQNKTLTGTALMTAVDKQTWDPSVKALTQFSSVLNNMAQNLSWTSQLGEAYHNQQADVMTAIQTLRAKAKAAGNLKSGSQITVVQQAPQTIVIQPTNPQIVYVPQYNPTVVYGYPYVTPGYSTGDLVATGLLSFGAGMAVGAMMSGGCCGWGYSSWNCNWHGGVVVYHGGAYYGNNAWHGGYYGSGSITTLDITRYSNGYNNNGYHANNYNNNAYNHAGDNNYNHTTNVSGNTVNMDGQGADVPLVRSASTLTPADGAARMPHAVGDRAVVEMGHRHSADGAIDQVIAAEAGALEPQVPKAGAAVAAAAAGVAVADFAVAEEDSGARLGSKLAT